MTNTTAITKPRLNSKNQEKKSHFSENEGGADVLTLSETFSFLLPPPSESVRRDQGLPGLYLTATAAPLAELNWSGWRVIIWRPVSSDLITEAAHYWRVHYTGNGNRDQCQQNKPLSGGLIDAVLFL